jgi:hypothetical protein
MSSFIKSAKAVYDIDSGLDYVEIEYERFVCGKGYETYMDYINTKPLADWVILKSKTQSIPYEKFLDTMCERTFEVRQKMAELVTTYIRTAHASRILDPTFQAPRINVKSAWQREFIKKFCVETLADLVQRCDDESRLEYFTDVLRSIELER